MERHNCARTPGRCGEGYRTMEPLGIMLYGYGKNQAMTIREALAAALGRDVTLISASGREGDTVESILNAEDTEVFEERETRILMFLGFSREEMSMAMDRFPGDGVARPIFCGLTESNAGWTLEYLLEHLLEEHARWTSAKNTSRP